MRKTLSFTTTLLVFSCLLASAQERPSLHNVFSRMRSSYATPVTGRSETGGPGNGSEFTGFSGTGANINVVYHRVNWTVDPRNATNIITGTVVTYFKTITSGVNSINFDLNKASFNNGSLSVTYHGSACSVSFPTTGNVNILNITLAGSPNLGNNILDSVTVNYSGVPPGVVGWAQGYQQGGTGAEKYTTSLSESYEDRDFWPCKADMQDKIDSMDINVTVPWVTASADTFWVATNGLLYDSTITGSNRTFKLKTRYPMASYLVCLSVAKFTRYHRNKVINGTNVPVVFYLLRNTGTQSTKVAAMDKITDVLDSFSRKFGDYPFKLEKHGFYDGLLGAGGMEHQTFSGMATGSIASLTTLTHELMHQWFGDNVSAATWNDIWLAEGPASFSEVYGPERVPALGYSAASVQTLKNNLKTSALSYTANSTWIPNSSIGSTDLVWGSTYGNTIYKRGGMVMTMLRALCGDTKFFQALTNYQTNLAGKAATTDSLKNYFNSILGTDISCFFNDYVGGSGSGTTAVGGIGNPINAMTWNTPATNKLVVKVGSQTRTGGTNVTYFRGPVSMHFTNAASGWTKDTMITIFDWGSGNLSYAGNGLGDPIPGNALNFDLSFTPTNAFYDDSAKTMTTGSMTKDVAFMGYTWSGATSSTWNTTSNWASCCAVPPSGAQVTISTTVNQPVLPGTITVGGLYLSAGSKLNIGNNTLVINGAVTGTGTITGSATSSITITDVAGTLNFDQTSAATRSLNNLTINSGGTATLGNAVDVFGTVSLSGASLDLNAQNLTLKSTITGTARIADLTGSTLTGATNVTVERYLSDVGRRAWRLLSVPVTGTQTIRQAWQENGVNSPNLGTNITSQLYTGSNGFDALSGSSSILTHVQGGVSGPSWNGTLANTNTTLLSAYPAYMLFVRGDKNATGGNSLHAPTVLRSTGTIRQGTQSAVTISATGTGYTLVGNPYPSPIDFETIAGTANLNQSYYMWDPTLTGSNGYGGYRLVQRTAPNTYQQTPVVLGGPPVVDPTLRYIHSGQGFFLKATGSNASVVFTEASKTALLSGINPIVAGGAGDQQLIVNLMTVDAAQTAILADGIRISYNDANIPGIGDDIIKIGNFSENLSSLREGKSLIVENRPMIGEHDTIFLRMTNAGIKNYRFQVGGIDFVQTNLKVWLQDNFLGTNTPIDLSAINNIDFSVTADPASAAQTRFKIIFAAIAPPPVSFTSIKAYQQRTAIAVEWSVTNQFNINKYEVEHAADGINFSGIGTQFFTGANGSAGTYNWADVNPVTGDNYYRIRSVGNAGEMKYSDIVKVAMAKTDPAISIYPNPVINHTIGIQFTGMDKGVYQLKLLNVMGQAVFTQPVVHNGGSAAMAITLGKTIARGYYRLELIKPDNSKIVKSLYITE